MMVAIASKKPASTRVKTATEALMAPMPLPVKAPNRSMSPKRPKLGAATGLPGHSGIELLQVCSGRSTTALTMNARTVPPAMPMRIAPRVLRASRMKIASRVTAKIRTGQPTSSLLGPSDTGGPYGSGPWWMKPDLTRPISATNRPMPMVIACLIGSGMPFMIFSRRPETTSSTISRP